MGTHVNHTVIVPEPNQTADPKTQKFSVAIVRGVDGAGNPEITNLDYIAHNLWLDQAVSVANGAMHIGRLDPYGNFPSVDARKPFARAAAE